MKTLITLIALAIVAHVASNFSAAPQYAPVTPKDTVVVTRRDTVFVDSLARIARASAQVESRRNPHARRFEPSVFYRLTGLRAKTYCQAWALNAHAAMMSTSYGQHQILGMNYRAAGFASLGALANADSASYERGYRFFVYHQNIDKSVKQNNWAQYAKRYNGAGYKRNKYDSKINKEMRG